MSEMYADYLEELGIKKMYKTEKGFAIYGISGKDCYLEELYVKKEYRSQSIATELADKICEIAREQGCNRLLGSVVPAINGASRNMQIFLNYGMKLESASTNFILLSKEIA